MIYLFVAYTLIWLGIAWYALMIGRKNRALSQQIETLERTLNQRRGAQKA